MNSNRVDLEQGFLIGLMEGTVAIPYSLLKVYSRLKLSEAEVMLLVHLIGFIQVERNDFPTHEEIGSRMSMRSEAVAVLLHKLHNEGFLGIDEGVDEPSGMRYEVFNLQPFYAAIAKELAKDGSGNQQLRSIPSSLAARPTSHAGSVEKASAMNTGETRARDIYTIFEQEFGRPLTPMELQTIAGWLDQDHYKEELILSALKEAVFTGKLYFRYVDRILLEWQRNRVVTVEQAKEYAQRFRGSR
ncbi:DnaD domain protein [Paenibacillus sp. N1-5-1-14]|uniref:DnaD domain-containing protein n=1 Tax=Paenibacillus radicibacter TaxID=2972488 RepID=UPI002158AD7B|nr:DnaD domain protein [Paenibacillus radicibacter]MCR8642235.1 DnaD domain protein [Paenibacillus radicibacter]